MRILVSGARGMVAQSTINHCRAIGDEVVSMDRSQMDISSIESVRAAVQAARPDVVINCAAFTDVDGAETNPEGAFSANVAGPRNLATVSREFDCGLVTISTDYVFDGGFEGFYTQRHQPNPRGVYASTKRLGEIESLTAHARTIVVRSGWIYGRRGTNFLSSIAGILGEGKRVRAISDSYGTPTFADDLAKRLRELAALDLPGIFHVTNTGEGVSYLGFAEKVCAIGGFDSSLLEPVSHAELKRPAPRPMSSKLACLFSERLGLQPMPHWEDALRRFINNKKKGGL